MSDQSPIHDSEQPVDPNKIEYKPYEIEVLGPINPIEKREAFVWFRDHPELGVHDAPEPIKSYLEREGIFTTCEPESPPENRWEFLLQIDTAKNLERLGQNVRNALKKVKGFRNKENIADKLEGIFQSIVKVRMEGRGVRPLVFDEEEQESENDDEATILVKPEEIQENDNGETDDKKTNGISLKAVRKAVFDQTAKRLKGTVYAEKTFLSVKTLEEAHELSRVLQALLKSPKIHYATYPLPDQRDEDGNYIVCIENYDEYANRQLGNALQQVRALEDKRKFKGFQFPSQKKSLFEYYHPKSDNEKLETFPPEIIERIHKMEEHYFRVSDPKALSYRIDKKPMEIDGRITTMPLAAEISGFFPAVRDLFRETIHDLRGDDSFNSEQNIIKGERLEIEENVELTRDQAEAGNLHPTANRAYNILERVGRYALRNFEEFAKNKNLFSFLVQIYKTTSDLADVMGMLNELAVDKLHELSNDPEEAIRSFQMWFFRRRKYERSRANVLRVMSTPRGMLPIAA